VIRGRVLFLLAWVLLLVHVAAGEGQAFRAGAEPPLRAGPKLAFQVGSAPALRKLFRQEPDTEAILAAKGPRIELARNEYQAVQVVVHAEGALKGLRVTVCELAQAGGEGSIPTSDITVQPVGYVPVIRPYYYKEYVKRPDYLWPDPLLEEQAVDVAAGDLQPFYLTVRTRPETPPGEYRGTVTVQAEGAPSLSLELLVRVWEFVLPKQSHLQTAFWVYGEQLLKYHKIPSKDDPRYGETLQAYYRDMLEHRMSPCEIGANRPCPRVDVLAEKPDFSAWDAWMQSTIDQGLNCFWVPLEGDTDSRERLAAAARVWGPHLREKGWSRLAYVFLVDESYDHEDWRQWVKEGDPELRNLLTHTPDAKYPAVDVWCPQMGRGWYAHPDAVAWAKGAGKTLWMYTSSPDDSRFYPNFNLDMLYPETRLAPWVCFKHDIPGYLYWCVNMWEGGSPWETAAGFRQQNGNGSVYYPGQSGPVHSIRLEAFRDGMQDYEYFWLLRQRVSQLREKGGQAAAFASQANALIDWGAKDDQGWLEELRSRPEALLEVRRAVAHAIEEADRLLAQ
jgi:hypothetical protein